MAKEGLGTVRQIDSLRAVESDDKLSPSPPAECFLSRTLLPASLVLVVPARLWAQAQASTGVIRGVVADSSGRPLDNATVSLRHLATNAELTLTTNSSGVYVATLLRVGVYDLKARAVGYREEREDSVAV